MTASGSCRTAIETSGGGVDPGSATVTNFLDDDPRRGLSSPPEWNVARPPPTPPWGAKSPTAKTYLFPFFGSPRGAIDPDTPPSPSWGGPPGLGWGRLPYASSEGGVDFLRGDYLPHRRVLSTQREHFGYGPGHGATRWEGRRGPPDNFTTHPSYNNIIYITSAGSVASSDARSAQAVRNC